MNMTNEVGLVTSARNFYDEKIRDLPPGGVLCVRLIAVGPTGNVVAISPIKVCRWSAIKKFCYYPFGDMEFRDASGNGLDLTATGLVSLENGGVTFATASNTKLATSGSLNLSGLSSFVASCWVRNAGSSTAGVMFMEQNSPLWFELSGAFAVSYDSSASFLNSFVGNLAVKGNPSYAIVASERGEFDSAWHNVAVVFSKKNYPDDVQVYVDGVNKSREITAAEKSAYRGSAGATTFANSPLTLGGRGDTYNLVGQMDEVVVAECPEGAADAVVAQIHGEGLLAVKGEVSSDSVTVEVPEGCPADQVFPPVGTTFGYAAGETVSVVAEGGRFDRWRCTLSTNRSDSAGWKTWRRLPAASGAFQHPGVPVKVSWRQAHGLVIILQ